MADQIVENLIRLSGLCVESELDPYVSKIELLLKDYPSDKLILAMFRFCESHQEMLAERRGSSNDELIFKLLFEAFEKESLGTLMAERWAMLKYRSESIHGRN